MTTTTTMPALAGVYATTAARAARESLGRSRRPSTLPERTLTVTGHVITADQLEAYRGLIGEGRPESVPSVLVHIAAFPAAMKLMAAPDFPLPLLGMVHLSNEVLHHGPVPIDTALTVEAAATGLVPHHAGTAVDMVVTVRDEASGRLLWEGMSRYLAKGVHLTGSSPVRPEREDFLPPSMTAQWRFTAGSGRRYAAVSGDYNPIHLSGLSARLLGMKSGIAHGMELAARMLKDRAPASAGFRWMIEFDSPVPLPSTVSVSYRPLEDADVDVIGWSARSGRRHFTGSVTALPGED